MNMSAYFARHAQTLVGSLGRIAAHPFEALMTMAVIGIGIALSYLDFRFGDLRWRDQHTRLAMWHAAFDARASVVANPPVDDR